jgi:hypothetical protein
MEGGGDRDAVDNVAIMLRKYDLCQVICIIFNVKNGFRPSAYKCRCFHLYETYIYYIVMYRFLFIFVRRMNRSEPGIFIQINDTCC